MYIARAIIEDFKRNPFPYMVIAAILVFAIACVIDVMYVGH